MSNELLKAADHARMLLRGFKAVAEVADALEHVGKLQQAQAEAEAALAALRPMIEAAKTEAERIKTDASMAVAAAREEADRLIQAAGQEAANIVAAAEQRAASIMLEAERIKDVAINAEAAAHAETNETRQQRDALVNECEALEQRLAKARAQVEKLLT